MKLFTYSFEESQSFVNETIISRFNDKGNWKRFIGMPLFSAIVYLLYILLPAVFKGIRLDGDGDVHKILSKIYNMSVAKNMIDFSGSNDDYKVYGFIMK